MTALGTATGGGAAGPVRTGEAVRLADRVRAAAERDGEDATVEALDVELARMRAGAAAVVVVGEQNRGKSSLVNRLAGHPGLLPVDPDCASCVHVVVSHGDAAAAWVRDAASPAGREIAAGEVPAYAALDPDTRRPRHDGVVRVGARVPSPLLAEGLELVDTPGVGGLVAGHAALTLATLPDADALLFVTDAHSEISAPELAFLQEASARVTDVAIVLTKVDAAVGWRTVLERGRELVAAHAPRYADAPWFPVSAALGEAAERAAAAGRDEVARRRRAESGMAALEEHLRRVARDAERIRLENLVRATRRGTERLVRVQSRRLHALTVPREAVERLRAEKAALAAVAGRQAAWRQALADRTARLDKELRTELARRVEDVRRETGDRIATGGADVVDQITVDLPARVQAVWVEQESLLRRGLPEVATAVADELAAADDLDLSEVLPDLPERLLRLPAATRGKPGTTLAEHGVTAMGLGSMTFSLTSVALGAVVGSIVGLVAGAAIVGVIAYRRNQKERVTRGREDARRFVADVCARLTTEVPSAMSAALAEAKEKMASRMSALLAEEAARLRESIDEHESALATEKGALTRKRAAAEKRLRELTELRDGVAALDGRAVDREVAS